MSGKELLKKIKKHSPDVFVIIISSQKEIETAVELLQEGAYDYIVKNDTARDRLDAMGFVLSQIGFINKYDKKLQFY